MNKNRILLIGIIILGILTSIGLFIYDNNMSKINTGVLYRNEYGEGLKDYEIIANIGGNKKHIKGSLNERLYNDEEIDNLLKEFKKELYITIKADNFNLDNISSDLNLVKRIRGYPFTVNYLVSEDELIDNTGKINKEKQYLGNNRVVLTAIICYEEKNWNIDYEMTIKKLNKTEDQILVENINQTILKLDKESSFNKKIKLPTYINGHKIVWEKITSKRSLYVLIGSFILSIIISIATEYDEKKRQMLKEEELGLIYPAFVEKLRLYMISGATVKKAFLSIYRDFSDKKEIEYRQINKSLNKMNNYFNNKVSEERIYMEFGQECGAAYKKLSSLLIVNLKKGNDYILQLLREETNKAFETRRMQVKRKCDLISVKLLFPMMVMLLVVLMMIMLPAYYGFS